MDRKVDLKKSQPSFCVPQRETMSSSVCEQLLNISSF